MTSFAELKAKRDSKNGTTAPSVSQDDSASAVDNDGVQLGSPASTLLSAMTQETPTSSPVSNSVYKLDEDMLEIRETPSAGRGLFAKKRISPGTVILHRKPHVALLDKEHLSVLCSNCMRERGRPLKRCSGCAAVWYCSTECQRAQWKPTLHKLECTKLRQWIDAARKAGLPSERQIPDTPIRAIGNMLLLKEHMSNEWWQEIEAMAGSPRSLTPAEQEQQGSLAVAITHYIGASLSSVMPPASSAAAAPTNTEANEDAPASSDAQSALVSIFPEYAQDTMKMTRALLQAIDKFGINSFSLTEIDLTNIGVAIAPSVALINHSCRPNCSVVFPNGPKGEMKVVAFSSIQPGEELLSSYLDLTMPIQKRQQELLEQYKFECACPECQEGKRGNELRRSVECPKSGCSGYIPLPGRAEMSGTKELPCIKCMTTRKVHLGGESDASSKINGQKSTMDKSYGIAWLIDQANALLPRLSKQAGEGLTGFEGLSLEAPQMDTASLLDKCISLCKEHHLTPYSYPYLALNRSKLESILINATAGPGSTTNYTEARALSRQVMSGLSRIYPIGHPVRAVQQVMLARLLSIGEKQGEEIIDIPGLRVAYEQMKIAYGEAKIAFGGAEADMVRDTERGLKGLERDIAWRETARRSMKQG